MLLAYAVAATLGMTGCLDDDSAAPGNVDDTAAADDTSAGDDTLSDEDTSTSDDTGSPTDTATPPDDTATPPDDTTTPPDEDTTTPPDDDTSTPPEDTTIVLPATPPDMIGTETTFIGDWDMNPGQEVTKCVVRRLGNADELWVSQIRTELAAGSHHMIVYKSSETEEQTEPFNCTPFIETLKGETFPLMITQIPNETLTFPNGVAFRFEPNQMIRIEAHYLNYFPDPITAHGDIHFDHIAAEDVVSEANMLFYGNPDFNLPPGQTVTTPWRYLSVPDDSRIFAVTGHTHQYGTNVEINRATSKSDDSGDEPIYPLDSPYLWDEPPVTQFDPALEFPQGVGVRYRCTWDNTTNQSIGFGESANKEMCFLWAYYYPSQGYRICVNPGGIGGGVAPDEVCCPGSPLCGLISQFL